MITVKITDKNWFYGIATIAEKDLSALVEYAKCRNASVIVIK